MSQQSDVGGATLATGVSDLDEIRFYYWESDLTVKEIALSYGLKAHEVLAAAGPLVLESTCGWCGEPEVVTSRSARTRRTEWWQGRSGTMVGIEVGRLPGDQCQACRESWRDWARERAESRAEETDRLREMPYPEYLKTEHWQEVRQAALKRAGYRCQTCNANVKLDVHHRTYERRGCERLADVVALCRPCHSRFHGVIA